MNKFKPLFLLLLFFLNTSFLFTTKMYDTAVSVILTDSNNNLLTTGSLRYYDGSWHNVIRNNDGTFTIQTNRSSLSYEMTYEHGSQTKSNIPITTSPVVFQTISVNVKLKNSSGNLIDQGTVEYYSGGWFSFGITNNGIAAKELLPKNYTFRMTYEYGSVDKAQDVGTNNIVEFQTAKAEAHLKNSQNILIDEGTVQYYSGGWFAFGTTSGGITSKELLPKNYTFRMSYEHGSIDKAQDIKSNSTIEFQTVNTEVHLKNSSNTLIDEGTIQYYSGGWFPFGATSGGVASKELLPKNYTFRMAYEHGSNDKAQDIGFNNIVEFQTARAEVQLKNSIDNFIDRGTVQYYAGGWFPFGTTDNGITSKELLPQNYTFRMNYEFGFNDKGQNISTDPIIIFNTTNVTVQLKNQNGILIDPGIVTYYSGGWYSFGTTINGVISKELLPKNYSFKMAHNNDFQQKAQDVSLDPLVIFQTISVIVYPVLTISSPIDGATTNQDSIVVEGTIDNPVNTSITINGQSIQVHTNGSFGRKVSLSMGNNVITVNAINSSGFITTKTINITREQNIILPPDLVTVAPPIDSTVATTIFASTEYIYKGANPIQYNVADNTIEPKRVCVLRGQVLDNTGSAMPGIKITILNHPEFGYTLSRHDGWFDMAVNGGGILTINYQKENYLVSQRNINVPWQDYTVVEKVVMVSLDTNVTTIDFNDTIEVARGTVVTDEDGTRQATLLFSQGTEARMFLPSGDSLILQSINVRATEYTIGDLGSNSMPAQLPPASAYTYCVELTADQSIQNQDAVIKFSKPVIFYVDNFVGFPIGINVPVGYYDTKKAEWIPSKNGRVIKIINTNSGKADIDYDGNGAAENDSILLSYGINLEERQKLASLYPAGKSLWRMEIDHFSKWDANWGWGPPDDAIWPNEKKPRDINYNTRPCKQSGSIIGIQDQTLGESINITGTPFSLFYNSRRTAGYKYSRNVQIPLSITTNLPPSLKRIDLGINISGQDTLLKFPAENNLLANFLWNGKDNIGRKVLGTIHYSIETKYIYDGKYRSSERFGYNGNGAAISGDRANFEIAMSQRWKGNLSNNEISSIGYKGWELDVVHSYDPIGARILKGNGDIENTEDYIAKISTIAGRGTVQGFIGNGVKSEEALLRYPTDITIAQDGTIYFIDSGNNAVRKIDKEGIISTVISNLFGFPISLAVDNKNNLYIIEPGILKKYLPNGEVQILAGNGAIDTHGYGDGGPATQAGFAGSWGIAIAPDGCIYFSDYTCNRVRRISTDGIISTIAGGGTLTAINSNGKPATQARLVWPAGITIGPDGSIYFTEVAGNIIRKVTPDGIIHNVTGNERGFSGDGDPAILANMMGPKGICIGSEGTIYFTDGNYHVSGYEHNYVIRAIDP